MRILVISDLYPNPASPIGGIFIQKQVQHLRPYCDQIIVSPFRLFPHLRLWKNILKPRQFFRDWRNWIEDINHTPLATVVDDIPVYYPRYTSPPRQIFHGTWGFFAYIFTYKLLRKIHAKNQIQLIHAHYASPGGVIAILAKKWMNVPVVLSIHGADVTYTARQNRWSASIIKWAFDNTDLIIANSTWTMHKIIEYGGNKNKIKIVPYGGDIPAMYSKPQAGSIIGDHGFNLLTVGYLKKSKGHVYVIQAVKQLVDMGYRLSYKIVGEGPEIESLTKLVSDLDLRESVHFEGAIPNDKIADYYQSCDIFVLPSWNEAFGIVYIEALKFGKPVIGCEESGGPEDLKSFGDCIELVQPRDIASLTTAIKKLLDDPERRQRMGELGKEIVTRYYTWQVNAEDTFAIYKQLTSLADHRANSSYSA